MIVNFDFFILFILESEASLVVRRVLLILDCAVHKDHPGPAQKTKEVQLTIKGITQCATVNQDLNPAEIRSLLSATAEDAKAPVRDNWQIPVEPNDPKEGVLYDLRKIKGEKIPTRQGLDYRVLNQALDLYR